MGNGFVAGRLDAASEVLGGLDGALFHSAILAWAVRSKNSTTEGAEGTEFGEEKTCPVVQFWRGNCGPELAIFFCGDTYYLVQEKL
jgi:hypothetical protein